MKPETWHWYFSMSKCGACGKDAVYPDGDAILKEWLVRVAKEKGLFAA